MAVSLFLSVMLSCVRLNICLVILLVCEHQLTSGLDKSSSRITYRRGEKGQKFLDLVRHFTLAQWVLFHHFHHLIDVIDVFLIVPTGHRQLIELRCYIIRSTLSKGSASVV